LWSIPAIGDITIFELHLSTTSRKKEPKEADERNKPDAAQLRKKNPSKVMNQSQDIAPTQKCYKS
jgi:hypothetical protein